MFILNGCGGGGSSSNGKSNSTPEENPLHIYPAKPVVASDDGVLQITATVEENGVLLQNSDEHVLTASYQSANETIASITSDGYLIGGQPGSTEITITIKDENTSKVYTRKVPVEVKTVNISKLFINPSVASIGKNKEKELYITALDKAKSPTELEGKYFRLQYSKTIVSATPIITSNDAKIKVRAKNEKGYTFITPIFSKAGVEITGDPVLIQISSIPQINIPNGLIAGSEVDFLRVKNGSGDDMYIVHTNEDEKIYLDYFNVRNGQWDRKDLDYAGDSIKAPKVMKLGKVTTIYAIVDNKKFNKLTSENGSSWSVEPITTTGFVLDNSIDFNNIDYVTIGSTVYALIGNKDKIVLAKNLKDSNEFVKIASFTTPKEDTVNSVDLALNRDNALRFTFTTEKGYVYYATVNEKIIEINEVRYTSDILEDSKLAYTKNNLPVIMSQQDGELVESEKTNGGVWANNKISSLTFQQSGIKDSEALDNMEHFDFKVDQFGNSRAVVTANDKLFYIKEYHVNDTSYWRVDTIVDKDVGAYVSMQIDAKNRLKVAYSDTQQDWVKYFAEPVYIKYNDGKKKQRVDDTIKATKVIKTITLDTQL